MLSNNSPEMKTVVETFIIEETAELIYDNEKLDRWNALVSELDLQGQTKISAPEKSPIPFMHLKQSLSNVLECLCPRKVDVSEFDVTPIPVEILDLIALSKREKYFTKIQIWYDEKSPDPVCVGYAGYWEEATYYDDSNKALKKVQFDSKQAATEAGAKHPRFEETNKYLLGKWADVKHSFEELREMATKRFIAQEGNDLRKRIKEAQRGLDDLEVTAFERFN